MLQTIYAEDRHRLLDYARSLTQDRDEAEDLVQEAYIRLVQHDYCVVSRNLYRQTIRNLWLDSLRHRRHVPDVGRRLADLAQHTAYAEDPEHLAIGYETLEQVIDAINHLSTPQRLAVIAVYVQELTCREWAARAGVSPNTVKSRLLGARHTVRQACGRESGRLPAPRSPRSSTIQEPMEDATLASASPALDRLGKRHGRSVTHGASRAG